MTLEVEESLVYRPYHENDIPFIRSSWASSYYKGASAHKILTNLEFHSFHRPLIDRFFQRPTATVIVVHHESEPEVIMGWIAVEILLDHLVIHYLYVKKDYRPNEEQDFKIASKLLKRVNTKNKRIICTHLTDKAKRIIQSTKYRNVTYIPHLI